eukprot:jgi/Psemu1/70434/estExt_Genemark1.C_21380004
MPKDIKWTDAQIRWPDDVTKGDPTTAANDNDDDENDESDDQENPFDPFADPDPTQIFPNNNNNTNTNNDTAQHDRSGDPRIQDRIGRGVGIDGPDAVEGIQLGAGLGLNGLLAHRLGAQTVVVTDGDSDAMVALRKNIAVNRQRPNNENENNGDGDAPSVEAAQLLWGTEHSENFREQQTQTKTKTGGGRFQIIIASDIVYSPLVIDPLWETVRALLVRKQDGNRDGNRDDNDNADGGEFWMAFAVRKVPVTIGFVLQRASDYGFSHELVDEQIDGHDYGDDNIEGDPETGKVYIYRFRWSSDEPQEHEQETNTD